MNIKPVVILAACAFFTGGCNKSPTSPTANNSGSQPPPAPIQAEPFHGQVYKSLNGGTVLTLVSKEECELAEGGTTLLCKYTKPNDTLRVVTTALGTSQVIYFRFTNQGLVDNNGNVLFSPEGLAANIQQQQLEQQRVADEKINSVRETQIIGTFSLFPVWRRNARNTMIMSPDQFVLTDVSLKIHCPEGKDGVKVLEASRTEIIYFAEIDSIYNVEPRFKDGEPLHDDLCFFTVYLYLPKIHDTFPEEEFIANKADIQSIHDAVLNAYNAWKVKFPEAVLK